MRSPYKISQTCMNTPLHIFASRDIYSFMQEISWILCSYQKILLLKEVVLKIIKVIHISVFIYISIYPSYPSMYEYLSIHQSLYIYKYLSIHPSIDKP